LIDIIVVTVGADRIPVGEFQNSAQPSFFILFHHKYHKFNMHSDVDDKRRMNKGKSTKNKKVKKLHQKKRELHQSPSNLWIFYPLNRTTRHAQLYDHFKPTSK
jgi:hypothetical protein